MRESLLLQLDRCTAGGAVHELARLIVSDHLNTIARGRYGAIAAALDVHRGDLLHRGSGGLPQSAYRCPVGAMRLGLIFGDPSDGIVSFVIAHGVLGRSNKDRQGLGP